MGIEEVEIRSKKLTCETKRGILCKCYGRSLSTSKMVQKGESCRSCCKSQSIGEPGTQLTYLEHSMLEVPLLGQQLMLV